MKVKLLKRLRAEAKKKYWIEEDKVGDPRKKYILKNLGGQSEQFGFFNDAKYQCDCLRRKYIYNYINLKKYRSPKRIY